MHQPAKLGAELSRFKTHSVPVACSFFQLANRAGGHLRCGRETAYWISCCRPLELPPKSMRIKVHRNRKARGGCNLRWSWNSAHSLRGGLAPAGACSSRSEGNQVLWLDTSRWSCTSAATSAPSTCGHL